MTLDLGLVKGHAYGITAVTKVDLNDAKFFAKLFNYIAFYSYFCVTWKHFCYIFNIFDIISMFIFVHPIGYIQWLNLYIIQKCTKTLLMGLAASNS